MIFLLNWYTKEISQNVLDIQYYKNNPESDWKGDESCKNYQDLSKFKNNLICLVTSKKMVDLSN